MKKNDRFTATCVDYTYDGSGIVKNDAFCVFVKDMAIGDTGEIVVTAVRKDYGYGRLLSLEKASEHRCQPACPISRQCGGCQLQHLSPQGQQYFKYNQVRNALERIGGYHGEILPVISMEDPFRYRNKVILPVGRNREGKPVMGFYRFNSHDIIEMEDCLLQSEYANDLAHRLLDSLERNGLIEDVRNIMIRDFPRTGEAMVVIVTRREDVDLNPVVSELTENDPVIKSIIQNVNSKETNVVLGSMDKVLYGSRCVRDTMCGLTFEISAHSFYQVNTVQTELLYDKAIELAAIGSDDTVIDLYCGTGTIGMIASKHAGNVIGVEIVPQAIEDAGRNARINGIENIQFICSDAEKAAEKLAEEGVHANVVIVDPPRKGCSQNTLGSILKISPDRLVYVSCNPATLARDIRYLTEHGYSVQTVQPFDQFPNTYHVESCVLLERMSN